MSLRRLAWPVAVPLLIGAAPLIFAQPVPLQDWPNHLAGSHVLAALLRGDPFWQHFYRVNTFLVPNAAVDLGLLGLAAAGFSEPVAANLFLLATYAVFVGGMVLLARALGALDGTRVALAVLLFYGTALFWGLANYVLAVGLMWGVLAIWLGVRHGALRLAVAGIGAAVLLFVHAVPAVALALLLACFDAVRTVAGARLRSCLSAPLAMGIVILLLRLLPGQTGHDVSLTYSGSASAASFVLWKLRLFASFAFGGSRLQDGASALAVLGVIVAIGMAARPFLSPAPALAIAGLMLLTLLAPERLGTGSLLDVRLAVLTPMLLAASVRLDWRGAAARRRCLAAVALLVAGRSAVIAAEWQDAARTFGAFRAQTERLPQGSIMMMAYGTKLADLSWSEVWSPPIQSIATQVVFRGVFFPALFANPDQQPIALRREFAGLGQPWNLTDPAHRRDSFAALAALCAGGAWPGVFLTELYAGAPFRLIDACDPAATVP